jgi:fructose-bisphosphate aldolase class I
MVNKAVQLERMRTAPGFIAALDQSGGSTPKALKLYGINEYEYRSKEEMFDRVHEMRTRIMTAPAFASNNIIGAILFDDTLDREVEGVPTTQYLLDKGILPILKIDIGLEAEADDCQLMKTIPNLNEIMRRATDNNVFGTKMRSVIRGANREGIREVVAQQFEIAAKILPYRIIPIIEPEVDINIRDKVEAEAILKEELLIALDKMHVHDKVIFKLTLPTIDNFYSDLMENDRTVRIVALSGGYSQEEANEILARNKGVIASFSRALTEGLSVYQPDEEFNRSIGISIKAIAKASNT